MPVAASVDFPETVYFNPGTTAQQVQIVFSDLSAVAGGTLQVGEIELFGR